MTSQMQVTDVRSLTVDQLKSELRSRNLPVKGKKAELRKRLSNNLTDIPKETEETSDQILGETTIDKSEFELFFAEYIEFKKYVFENLNNVYEKFQQANRSKEEQNQLKMKNKYLKEELKSKQKVIDILLEQIQINTHTDYKRVNENWSQIAPSNKTTPKNREENKNITTSNNRFTLLDVETCKEVLVAGKDFSNSYSNEKISSPQTTKNNSFKRNGFVVDQRPDRNINSFKMNTIPGNSSYANIVRNGKKIALFGDSITKRVRGKEMNKHLLNGRAFIKSFPGARSKELNHYIVPTIAEENPDAVVIHVGTNDLNPKRGRPEKSNQKIAEEIVQIGRDCRFQGINQIFISSITCRRKQEEMEKVREINNITKGLCATENFNFISNDSINVQHLWKDGLHLLEEGTNILANNIINSLNKNLL